MSDDNLIRHVSAIGQRYNDMTDAEKTALQKLFGFACRVGLDQKPEPVELPSLLGGLRTVNADPPGATLADQILEALPALIKEFPKGPAVKDICERIDADERHVRSAIFDLHKSGRARRVRRSDSPAWHLIPLGYEPPPLDLSQVQARVFHAIKSFVGDDGLARVSKRQLCEAAPASMGGIQAIIDALKNKGVIEIVETGVGSTPSTYRLLRENAEAGE